jgi:hypothetical protein
MTENSRLIGSRRGADILRSASATHNDDSVLKNAASAGNLRVAEASIWRISAGAARASGGPNEHSADGWRDMLELVVVLRGRAMSADANT